ncbi:phosphate ABC transporter substrate-binding protein [Aliivibrio finisterrensis]|uniref:Phosphate ABC transporter substrate-binding protein n=1 Tax=Aliivibrio finisterrensis TaxID=511998 RepID=A0A6N6RT23_9GAMM|nr:phosphate ABC transporter substrate-binding protein [Aliivibrio finisterrensis]KAB2824576.1 phosphate ABC transporter substrate-binding protein [Aliivibrio finisterrensis]
MFKALSYTTFITGLLFSSTLFAADNNMVIAGSTSVSTLLEPFIEEYNQATKPSIDLQSIGSSAGITMLENNIVSLAISSRQLTPKEKLSLSSNLIAYDAIAIITHPDNPINNLSADNIWKIYHGDITNWKQVGGEDKEIAVITREIASGSRFSFEKHLKLTKEINSFTVSDISKKAIVVNGTSMVKSIVARNPHAIGYVSAGSIGDLAQLQVVKINGLSPSTESISDKKYPLSRPFLFVYKNEDLSSNSQKFIDYINSKQSISKIKSLGYVKE